MEEIKILELFGGIGAIRKAFERQKIPHKVVDYVEIDEYAVKSYNAIFNENFESQDVSKWDKDIEIDFIMHGSPCTDISVAGKQLGADEGSGTMSSLMYETIRIVNKLKPKYVVWENVKNLISNTHSHNFNKYLKTMEEFGYNNYYKVLNAKDYGVPQNRERIFTVSIRNDIDTKNFWFPNKKPLTLRLKNILEENVDEKYYICSELLKNLDIDITDNVCSDFLNPIRLGNIYGDFKGGNFAGNIYDKNGVSPTLNSMQGGNHQPLIIDNKQIAKFKTQFELPIIGASRGRIVNNIDKKWVQSLEINTEEISNTITSTLKDNYVIEGETKSENFNQTLRIRKLTPKECWRLMGFDDEDFEKAEKVVSNTQLYKQAGNSIVVNVLEGIINNLFRPDPNAMKHIKQISLF